MLIEKEEPLNIVRSLFYSIEMGHPITGNSEVVKFLGPDSKAGTDLSDTATEGALVDFIVYWEREIEDVKEYLLHNQNPNVGTWKTSWWSPKRLWFKWKLWSAKRKWLKCPTGHLTHPDKKYF